MNNGEIIYWLIELFVGIYILGIGYKYFPDPVKKSSIKNKTHFDKFRGMFKIIGILILIYVPLSILSSALK